MHSFSGFSVSVTLLSDNYKMRPVCTAASLHGKSTMLIYKPLSHWIVRFQFTKRSSCSTKVVNNINLNVSIVG